jgi:hypothetical protein
MANSSFFKETKNVYWPAEYADIVNMLQGMDGNGESTHPPMYKYNTSPLILAAAIGLFHGRYRENADLGSSRKEINTDIFEGHKFGNSELTSFIALISVLGKGDIELLREGNESEILKVFQSYAIGGLEYLRGSLSNSSDTSGQQILFDEIQKIRDSKR